MASLQYQFLSAINANFKPGLDKHSYKKNKNCKSQKIVSYEYRRGLVKFASNLCNYLKENYPEVKYIKQITPEHMKSFFDYKSTFCTNYTIRQYISYTRVLDRLIKQHFHFNSNLSKGYSINKLPKNHKKVKLRNVSMKHDDYSVAIKDLKKGKSKAIAGIELAEAFGLRVSEVCKLKGKDIDLEKGIVHIHDSKGKRSRNVPIDTLLKIELCQKIKENVKDDERVCPLREKSVNAALKRSLIKNNITRYKNSKTGIHSIRKMVAKDQMHIYKKEGMTKQQAIDATSKYLGHNKNRNYVINAYIKSK